MLIKKMSATYGISTYGKEYLTDEGFEEPPPTRYVLIGINVLLWIIPSMYIFIQFRKLRAGLNAMAKRRQAANALALLTYTFIAFTVNNALRCSHMVDHVYRPVYYHEPKWAYAKIWLVEMEVPTYANILMAFFALQGMRGMQGVISQWSRKGLTSALVFMTLYVLGSLFNLVHYTIEPPQNYGPFPNFNISGTAITNIPIIYLLVKTYLAIPKGKAEQLLKEESSAVRASGRKRAPVNRLSY